MWQKKDPTHKKTGSSNPQRRFSTRTSGEGHNRQLADTGLPKTG